MDAVGRSDGYMPAKESAVLVCSLLPAVPLHSAVSSTLRSSIHQILLCFAPWFQISSSVSDNVVTEYFVGPLLRRGGYVGHWCRLIFCGIS
jgi:hypothetical protein